MGKAAKIKTLPGHVWMKTTKGAELQIPRADAVGLTIGKKPFAFMYPEDDPRSKPETKETATDEK